MGVLPLAFLVSADWSWFCNGLHETLQAACSTHLEGTCTLALLTPVNTLCSHPLQEREAEYEESVAKEEQPVVSCTI